jgi:predicted ATPase
MSSDSPPQVVFGSFRLDRVRHHLYRAGAVIPLRPKAFAVLDHLVAHAGRLVRKDELLAAVWPKTIVTDTVLKVCVREIREALGDTAATPRFIETAHRLGYRFIGSLARVNLPVPVSSLIGREREIAEIVEALGRTRLLTLTGAGGSGKSRLAVEAGALASDTFEDGVWWMDLAPISDERFLPQALADTLGIRDQPGESMTTLVSRFLAMRSLLLIVDNCEHVVTPVTLLLQSLLHSAPRLQVLATSREPLKCDGERVWPVPPLALPVTEDPQDESALNGEAVRLFTERATAVLPSFTLTGSATPAVLDIVRQLDGMPLAIELAAARVGTLAVEQIARQLHDCFPVLGGERRAVVPRHQTLRAAIDWSYDLLSADEQRLLRRLAVFVDTFELDAAEQIDRDARELISHLIDKSLVTVSERSENGRWRYRLLETIRQYALEKLMAETDAARTFARHANHFAQLAEQLEPSLNTVDRQTTLMILERNRSNLLAGIERSLRSSDYECAARLASALFWFWFHRGHWREGRTYLGQIVGQEAVTPLSRARALLGDGVLAWTEGDHETAAQRLEACIAITSTLVSADVTRAHALHFLAMVRLAQGRADSGRPLAEEAVAIARGTTDLFCRTIALASHGVLLLVLGELDAARAALEDSVSTGRQANDMWALALPLRNLAIIACRRGDYDRARSLLGESIGHLQHLGERWFLSRSIETLAQVLSAQGEYEHAAQLFGAGAVLREAVGASVLEFYRTDYEQAVAAARDALGASVFAQLWEDGRRQSPDAEAPAPHT